MGAAITAATAATTTAGPTTAPTFIAPTDDYDDVLASAMKVFEGPRVARAALFGADRAQGRSSELDARRERPVWGVKSV
eukprot:1869926-Pyramimonas_sp.AAC.1